MLICGYLYKLSARLTNHSSNRTPPTAEEKAKLTWLDHTWLVHCRRLGRIERSQLGGFEIAPFVFRIMRRKFEWEKIHGRGSLRKWYFRQTIDKENEWKWCHRSQTAEKYRHNKKLHQRRTHCRHRKSSNKRPGVYSLKGPLGGGGVSFIRGGGGVYNINIIRPKVSGPLAMVMNISAVFRQFSSYRWRFTLIWDQW